MRDVVKNIVYSATRHSVERVYVNGKCIMKDGVVAGIDEADLTGQLQELSETAWSKVSERDPKHRTIDVISPLSCPKVTIK